MPGFNLPTKGPDGISQGQDPTKNPNPNIEFHRAHRWIIVDLGLPGPPVVERLYAKSIQLPSLTFDEEAIKSGAAIDYKIAKKAKWQDMTIKFYDVYGLYEHFRKWQERIWSPAAGIGAANEYKRRVELMLTDGEGEEKQLYTAYGAYPKSVTHGELSYDSSEVKLLTVTYSYDFATIKTSDTGQGSSGP